MTDELIRNTDKKYNNEQLVKMVSKIWRYTKYNQENTAKTIQGTFWLKIIIAMFYIEDMIYIEQFHSRKCLFTLKSLNWPIYPKTTKWKTLKENIPFHNQSLIESGNQSNLQAGLDISGGQVVQDHLICLVELCFFEL